MSAPNNPLDSLFNSARSDQSPISQEDVRNMIETEHHLVASRPPRSFKGIVMSPAFVISSAAALALATGLTITVIHNGEDTKKTIVMKNGKPAESSITSNSAPELPEVQSTETDETTRTKVAVVRTNVNPTARDFSWATENYKVFAEEPTIVYALQCNDKVAKSLAIETSALNSIAGELSDADSVVSCSRVSDEKQIRICIYNGGAPREVLFMKREGPMPVMLTSVNGRGHIISTGSACNFDANKLIPVASSEGESDVVMWYPPSTDFFESLPDSLGEEIQDLIEMEVLIEQNDGDMKIIHKERKKDGSVKERNFKYSIPNVDSMMKQFHINVDSLMADVKVDSIMKSINIDSLMQSVQLQVDSTHKHLKQMQKFHFKFRHDDDVDVENPPTPPTPPTPPDAPRIKKLMRFSTPSASAKVLVVYRNGTKEKRSPAFANPKLQESRTAEGAVMNTSLFPNPTTDGGATLGYTLREDRTVNLELHDLSGTKLAELAKGVRKSAGEGQMAFTLNNIPAGMYLVTMTTDHNERVVQRLIVQ